MYLTFLARPRTLVRGEGFPSADCPEDGITEEPKGESINNAINDLSWTGNRLPCIMCVAPSWSFNLPVQPYQQHSILLPVVLYLNQEITEFLAVFVRFFCTDI